MNRYLKRWNREGIMNIQIVNDGALLNQHKFQFLKQYVFNFPNLIRYSKNSNNDIYVNFVGFLNSEMIYF